MTWCRRCGYDYGFTSHACGGSGNFPIPSPSVISIDFTNFQARGGNGAEPTFTKAEVEQLIEAIAVGVEGLDKRIVNVSLPAEYTDNREFISLSEVLEAIRSAKT